jgi:hypothetical protein
MVTKKYRLSWKAIAGEFVVIVIVLPFLLTGLGMASYVLQPLPSGEYGTLEFITSKILGVLGLILLLFSLVLCALPFGRPVFSYLAVSDSGIEYRYWPFYRIHGTWQDVDEIYKSPLPLQGEMLRLKSADTSGYQINISIKRGKIEVGKTIPVIPLYIFSGWSNRELQAELKNHAPNLFINSSSK